MQRLVWHPQAFRIQFLDGVQGLLGSEVLLPR
jgi:hypothetical protein